MRANRPTLYWGRIIICSIGLCAVIAAQAQVTWRRSYGGNGSDMARSVEQALDGGYVIAGSTGSFGSGGDGYVLKLDEFGDVQWSRYYGEAQVDEFNDIEVLLDGYLVVGVTSSPSNGGYDGLLMRLDHAGNVLWRRNFGSPEWDFLYSVDVDEDGYFLSGTTYSNASFGGECWVVRTDLEGEVIWSASTGGQYDDEARAVQATSDGGCVFAGSIGEVDDSSDLYVGRIDAEGDVMWALSWGTDSIDKGSALDIMEDGNIIVGGSTRSFMSYQQLLLAKVDPAGTVVWTSPIGQISDWEGFDVRVRPSGGFAMAASTTAFGFGAKDMYLLLTDSDGQYEFGTTFGGAENEEALALDLTGDGSFVLAGSTESFGSGSRAVFVVKTGTDGLTEFQTVENYFDPVAVPEHLSLHSSAFVSSVVQPNEGVRLSTALAFDAQITVVDGSGRLVHFASARRGSSLIPIPTLPSGLYSLTIANDTNRSAHRFVVSY